jgi:hypothetical protein
MANNHDETDTGFSAAITPQTRRKGKRGGAVGIGCDYAARTGSTLVTKARTGGRR